MTRRKTQEEFVLDVHNKYGKGYEVISTYRSLTTKVGFKHVCGYMWEIKPSTMYQSKKEILCPNCLNLAKSKYSFYKSFYEKYPKDEFKIVEGTFTKGKNKVKVKHGKCGTVTTRRAYDFLEPFYGVLNACAKCSEGYKVNEQKRRIRDKISQHKNHEEFEIVSGTVCKFKLRHKKCGEEFYKYQGRINNVENIIPCPECQRKERIKKEDEKNKLRKERELIRLRKRDLTGKIFGYLTALEDVGLHGNTEWRSWKCLCECGEITYVPSTNLRNGHTQSCGCNGRDIKNITINGKIYKRQDLTGKRFGKLEVVRVENHHKISSNTTWLCNCDCGGTLVTSQQVLMNGITNSCGCLRRDDISGIKYGKLTAIKYDVSKSLEMGYTYWECVCDCGTFKSVYIGHLKSGGTSSCGCVGMSVGETFIQEELDKCKVNYSKEYWFDDLRDVNPLRFDFALLDNKNNLLELIEFDGRQHFVESELFRDTLEEIQYRDGLKNDYCKKNNIPLTRIHYKQIGYIEEIVEGILKKHNLI